MTTQNQQQKANWIENLVDAPSPSEWRALKAKHEAELRRLQTRIAELEAQLEAIGAGGVEPLRKPAAQAVHQIAEPAAPVGKPIKDAIDALVMAAFTEGGCSEHRMSEARIQTELRKKELCTLIAATQPAAQGMDARDAAFEAVRKAFCKVQRYSFLLDSRGNVRRCADHCGNWVEFEAVHTLFDPQSVDAALAAQAKQGGA